MLILEYSQPVWELRVEGPPGAKFERCVVRYPWWSLGYGFEGYYVGQDLPAVTRYRTTRLDPHVRKLEGPGPLRVTLLRNGMVIESGQAQEAFGGPGDDADSRNSYSGRD
jgi:hypothetical protein